MVAAARARSRVVFLLAAAVGLLGSCSTPPNAPSPPESPPPPPASAPNTPPIIRSLTAITGRTEVNRTIDVTGDVVDAETPLTSLIYQWSANAGTFSGTGPQVTWRLAPGATLTPVDVTITLTIIELYSEIDGTGQRVAREHRVTSTATPFRVHDSTAEISRMALTFLIDYFGNSNVSPDACLVDFSDLCPGKARERGDIVDNRLKQVMLSSQATIQAVHFNGDLTFAEVFAPCTFRSISRETGKTGTVTGDCYLTAIYAQSRWWLCESLFNNGRIIEFFRRVFGGGGPR
jgi:hypothetical protein